MILHNILLIYFTKCLQIIHWKYPQRKSYLKTTGTSCVGGFLFRQGLWDNFIDLGKKLDDEEAFIATITIFFFFERWNNALVFCYYFIFGIFKFALSGSGVQVCTTCISLSGLSALYAVIFRDSFVYIVWFYDFEEIIIFRWLIIIFNFLYIWVNNICNICSWIWFRFSASILLCVKKDGLFINRLEIINENLEDLFQSRACDNL